MISYGAYIYHNLIFSYFLAFTYKNENNRLVILSGKFDGQLFKDFNRSQIEKRYGGDLIDLEQFWYLSKLSKNN